MTAAWLILITLDKVEVTFQRSSVDSFACLLSLVCFIAASQAVRMPCEPAEKHLNSKRGVEREASFYAASVPCGRKHFTGVRWVLLSCAVH